MARKTIDLNLLPVALAVFEEGSVTKAAKKLGMSQPAVSAALGRLRVILDDELFEKTEHGIQPTPKASYLIPRMRSALYNIEKSLTPAFGFDPVKYRGTFCISVTEIGEAVLLLRIFSALRRISPRIGLRSVRLPPDRIWHGLQNREIDLAVGFYPEIRTTNIIRRGMFPSQNVCLMRADHSIEGNTLSLNQYLELNHIHVDATGRNRALDRIAAKKLNPRVVLTVTSYLSVPTIVASSDLVATVPVDLAMYFVKNMPKLKIMKIPTQVPNAEIAQYWYRGFDRDPRIRWLRNFVERLFRDETGR